MNLDYLDLHCCKSIIQFINIDWNFFSFAVGIFVFFLHYMNRPIYCCDSIIKIINIDWNLFSFAVGMFFFLHYVNYEIDPYIQLYIHKNNQHLERHFNWKFSVWIVLHHRYLDWHFSKCYMKIYLHWWRKDFET